MRNPWLIIGLLFTLSACSNATFKGVKGSSDKDSTPAGNNDDATGTTPGTDPADGPPPPGSTTPPVENPNTQNPNDPGTNPCDMLSLLTITSLYQLHDAQCHDPEDDGMDDDDGDNDDDDDLDDDDDDDGDQNNPGQNGNY